MFTYILKQEVVSIEYIFIIFCFKVIKKNRNFIDTYNYNNVQNQYRLFVFYLCIYF